MRSRFDVLKNQNSNKRNHTSEKFIFLGIWQRNSFYNDNIKIHKNEHSTERSTCPVGIFVLLIRIYRRLAVKFSSTTNTQTQYVPGKHDSNINIQIVYMAITQIDFVRIVTIMVLFNTGLF